MNITLISHLNHTQISRLFYLRDNQLSSTAFDKILTSKLVDERSRIIAILSKHNQFDFNDANEKERSRTGVELLLYKTGGDRFLVQAERFIS